MTTRETAVQNWDALDAAVKERREKLGILRHSVMRQQGGIDVVHELQSTPSAEQDQLVATIEAGLNWPSGLVDKILLGEVTDEELGAFVRGDHEEDDYDALARAVSLRRAKLRLPVDLSRFGGPAEMTVRRIESRETTIQHVTQVRLETALRWPEGLVIEVLTGRVSAEEAAAREIESEKPNPIAELRASLSRGPDARTRRFAAVAQLSIGLMETIARVGAPTTTAEERFVEAAAAVIRERLDL